MYLRTDTLFTPAPCLKGTGASIYLLIASQNPINMKLSKNLTLMECEDVNAVQILEHILATLINMEQATKVCGCFWVCSSCSPTSSD